MEMKLSLFESPNEIFQSSIRCVIIMFSLIVFDIIWFTFTKKYYPITKSINYYSGILAWLLLSFALCIQTPDNYKEAIIYSSLVGFIIYGIYNFTNYTFLKEWKIINVIMDLMWGIFNCSLAGTLLYYSYWKYKS